MGKEGRSVRTGGARDEIFREKRSRIQIEGASKRSEKRRRVCVCVCVCGLPQIDFLFNLVIVINVQSLARSTSNF